MDKHKTQMEEKIKQHDCIMKSNDNKEILDPLDKQNGKSN